jgi:hypothetical protein
MIELVFTAYFMVQVVERESDTSKTYNILLEQDQGRGRAHNLVAHWTEDPNEFKEGQVLLLRVHGECTQVYEVHEGSGKRGSPWRAEDDWYMVGRPYICNATKVEKL